MSLVDRQLAFVAALREAGLTISVAETVDAARTSTAIDLGDRDEFRAALAAALVKRQLHRPAFDRLFDIYYPPVTGPSAADGDSEPDVDAGSRGPLDDPVRERIRAELADYLRDGDDQLRDAVARAAVSAFGAISTAALGRAGWSRLSVLDRVSAQTLMAGLLAQLLRGQDRGGIAEQRARTMINSRIALFEAAVEADVRRRIAEDSDAETAVRGAARPTLERINIVGATRAELAALRREVAPLARRLATRLTLDHRRGARGQLDFRRTIRASLSSGGVPISTRHRPRRPLRTDLVVLCDISESVSSFAHFTLLLVYALREQFGRVRAFAFVDELDEVTRFFTPGGDVLDAVTKLADEADVVALLGRTDYGRAFELFAQRFPDVIGPRTSLLVLGDARSNYGDLALPVLAQFVARAKHAYWLNPERRSSWDTGDSRAAEFGAVLPMVECRNLAQLGEFVRSLAR